MSDWVGLFINYETVGKQLKPHKTEVLNRKQSESEKLYPYRAVIQINSTYLELIDRWNFWRGFTSIFALFVMGGGAFGIYLMAISIYGSKYGMGEGIIEIFLLICCIVLLWIGWHFFRRECFSYTHYPIRFNRKLKKVYVIQPNKRLLVANWEDFHIGLQQYNRRSWDVRFSLLDDQKKVIETFALPYTGFSQYDPFLLGHWEFVRRYMEDDSAEVSYDSVAEVFPIHHRKESFKEIVTQVLVATTGARSESITRSDRLAFWATFPFRLIEIVGRTLSVKTSKIPKFPDWVEQECKIETNDPYDFEQHPKPKLQSEPIKPFEYVIYTALLLISIVIFLGFIDLLSLAKGENSGLLKALFFWW